MSKVYTYSKNQRATVCADSNCVTVYGDTAKIINGIAIALAILSAIALIAKLLK